MKHPGITTYAGFGTQAVAWVRFERKLETFPYLLTAVFPGITIVAGSVTYAFAATDRLLDPVVTASGTGFTFAPGKSKEEAAANMAACINGEFAGYGHTHNCNQPILPFFALCYGATVVLVATEPGTAGNAFAIAKFGTSSDITGCLTLSGATFAGGAAPYWYATLVALLDLIEPLSGAGSPEGVVTAVVGRTYTQIDAPGVQWLKVSGSGNTGWAVNT